MRRTIVVQLAAWAIAVACTPLAAQQPAWVAQLGYAPGQTFTARRAFRGMPFVEVVIAGRARWLLFDTGNTVGFSLATPVIDELHLSELGRWKSVDADGRVIGTFRRVRAPALELLGHVLSDQTVFEIADTALVGLVGPDALPGTRFTIDYQGQLLAVTDAPLEDPPPGFIALPLVRSAQHPRLILAMGRVGGRPVLMEFDTGASRSSIDPRLARDLGLPATANGVRIDSLSLGSLTFAVASARLDAKSGIDPGLSPPLQLSVGSDILAQVVFTVDFSTGRLFLADARRPLPPLPAQHLHHLPATPRTVAYGYYSATATPVLRIASGDTIDVETLITNRPDRLEAAGVAPADVQQSLRDIVTQVTDRGPGGHILTGPVYVEGADSGDVLEVRILAIDLGITYGYNGCSGFLPSNCDSTGRTRIIPLDRARMVAHYAPGLDLPLHPFFGSMGVAPPRDSGRVSSNPPGIHAGNMDNKELVAGTTLFIPIHAAGALFEVGDGHAAQGDGEVDQTAIETSLTGRLQLIVRKDLHLTWPRAETPTHVIAMGMDKDLNRATQIAVQNAVDVIAAARGWSKMEAYRLVSIACDLRITELVDGNVGVHVMIPKSILGVR